MAKARPKLTLKEMEEKLGYRIDYESSLPSNPRHFYSDFRLVPDHVYGRTLHELEKRSKHSSLAERADTAIESPERLSDNQIVQCGRSVLDIKRIGLSGHFTFAVNVTYEFGLSLPFLFTEEETVEALSMSKFTSDFTQSMSPLSKLPTEIRERIYFYSIPYGVWQRRDQSICMPKFAKRLGDYSGFYFPFGSLGMLAACKQMRYESLALLYRKTAFHLDDIDEVIQLLIAVGDIGRQNIESLEFAWNSGSDFEYQRTEVSTSGGYQATMPILHVNTCVQLLHQCHRLRALCLLFDSEVIETVPLSALRHDIGLQQLCSVRGLHQLQVLDLCFEPLKQSPFTTWLQEAMLSPRRSGKEDSSGDRDVSNLWAEQHLKDGEHHEVLKQA